MATLSIIMPVFNERSTVEAAIADALGAPLPVDGRELIVVDDGSTDGTLQIARSFEPKGVRVLTGPNQGVSAARNRGIAETCARARFGTMSWIAVPAHA